MNPKDANRPLRIFDKVLEGGLGRGNLGVLMSRHGTGKLAVLTSIVIDHAMDGRNTLHVALNESISDVRAYHDEVLQAVLASLDINDRAGILTRVERHKQIYTYRSGGFSLDRLEATLGFLRDRAEFTPEMIELQGWPDFSTLAARELEQLKAIAAEHQCEIWLSSHTKRDDRLDELGVPDYLARFADLISVLIALEPEGKRVNIRFVRAHGKSPAAGLRLEFDPSKMLIRWH